MVTRRQVLAYGAVGALVLALGGVGVALQGTVPRTPRRPLKALGDREYAILAAAADRLIVPVDGAPSAADALVAEGVDALLASSDPAVAVDFAQVLHLLENALFHLGRGARTFTASSPEVQDAILEDWRTSRFDLLRTAYKAVNGLVGATYYATPSTYAAVGYPGPPDYGNYVPRTWP